LLLSIEGILSKKAESPFFFRWGLFLPLNRRKILPFFGADFAKTGMKPQKIAHFFRCCVFSPSSRRKISKTHLLYPDLCDRKQNKN